MQLNADIARLFTRLIDADGNAVPNGQEHLHPSTKWRCYICAMRELKGQIAQVAVFLPDEGEIQYPSSIDVRKTKHFACGTGWTKQNAWKHLMAKHFNTVDGHTPSEAVPLESWHPVAREFVDFCAYAKANFGWKNFGVDIGQKKKTEDAYRSSTVLAKMQRPLAESIVINLCETYRSFASVERKSFKAMFLNTTQPDALKGVKFCRKYMKEVAVKLAESETAIFFEKHRNSLAYISVDVGTVWRRYVGVCLHIRGLRTPYVLRLIDDRSVVDCAWMPTSDDESGRDEQDFESLMTVSQSPYPRLPSANSVHPHLTVDERPVLTGTSMRSMISCEVDKLIKKHNILVLSVTTDNGSNMVSMSKDLQSEAGPLWPIRCACHVFQLIVKVVLEHEDGFKLVWNAVEVMIDQYETTGIRFGNDLVRKKFPPLIKTRWAAHYERLKILSTEIDKLHHVAAAWRQVATEKGVDANQLSVLFRHLKKFHIATRLCEAADSTMLNLLQALSLLQPTIDELCEKFPSLKPLIDNHIDKLIAPPLIITSFFTPLCVLDDILARAGGMDASAYTSLTTSIFGWLECDLMKFAAKTLLITLLPGAFRKSRLSTFVLSGTEVAPKHLLDTWKQKSFREEHAILMAIVNMRPSEAEVERLFSRVKLTASKFRKSLSASTVECVMKINYIQGCDVEKIDSDDECNSDLPITKACVTDVLARATRKHRSVARQAAINFRDNCFHCQKKIPTDAPDIIGCQCCGRRTHNGCTRGIHMGYWVCGNCSEDVVWF